MTVARGEILLIDGATISCSTFSFGSSFSFTTSCFTDSSVSCSFITFRLVSVVASLVSVLAFVVSSFTLIATVGLLSIVMVSATAVTPEKALITKELHKPMVANRCHLVCFMSSLLSMYHSRQAD